MKEGFYIRYVPVISEWTFYYFYNNELFYLNWFGWLRSSHDKPSDKDGFKRVNL